MNAFIINITAMNIQNYEKFSNKIKRKLVIIKKLKKKFRKISQIFKQLKFQRNQQSFFFHKTRK